jgi:hypothetical protein
MPRFVSRRLTTFFTYYSQTRRGTDALVIEIPEESDQFRFLRVVCLDNLKVN